MTSPARPPALVAVCGDPRTGGLVERELRTRYGSDYEVYCAGSADDALSLLDRLRQSGQQLALVLADKWTPRLTGTEFLAEVRHRYPTAKRLLLVGWADRASLEQIMQAPVLGQLDAYAFKPAIRGDERFHRAVTELLDEWTRSQIPGFEVVRVVGEANTARSHELRDLLNRNGVPFGFYPAGQDPARRLLDAYGAGSASLPTVVLFDGRVLHNPSNAEIAEALGVNIRPAAQCYDVSVLGAGPAGLAAAVHGASEGLPTAILEPRTIGGQAGMSSRIRNYPGFPTGVEGSDLTWHAYQQAWLLGAEFIYGNAAVGIRADGPDRVVSLADGSEVRSRAVVIATGVSYRRLGIPALDALIGAGVFYGAATSEAKAMRDRDVYVVGAANSAGQAAIHLATYAARVTILARARSLAESMSDYLIQEIKTRPNIAVRYGVELVDGGGHGHLQSLTLKDRQSGRTDTVPAAALFVLIGAEPRTEWLPDDIVRDRWGFVVTGNDLMQGDPDQGVAPAPHWPLPRPPMMLESSMPGVFAAGDVRHGSVKRVACAVGEGSIAIHLIHEYLRNA